MPLTFYIDAMPTASIDLRIQPMFETMPQIPGGNGGIGLPPLSQSCYRLFVSGLCILFEGLLVCLGFSKPFRCSTVEPLIGT